MEVQVLVAAMNQNNHSILDIMNIQSDVIVGNQCEENLIEKFDYKGHKAMFLNFAEKGVGLNRNNALMRATGDICLFADDDMVYVDNYVEIVREAFIGHPSADIIVFNLIEKVPTRYIIRREQKIGHFNYLRYGTARIAVRLQSIKSHAIYFNQCFGGGAEHSHGEDNIFLAECLKKGLRIYAVPEFIAYLTEERGSTWRRGYGKKYFQDQGELYKEISRRWWRLLCLQDAIRHRKMYNMSWFESYKKMTLD